MASVTTLLKAIATEDLGECWQGRRRHGAEAGVAFQLSQGEHPGGGWQRGLATWLQLARSCSELIFFPRIKPLPDPK